MSSDQESRGSIAYAIERARNAAAPQAVDPARQHFDGSLHRAVEVLLDLGLSDEAIAAYLLRFNCLQIGDFVRRHSRVF